MPDDFSAAALNTLQSFAYTLEDLEDSWKETLYQALGTYDSNVWQKYSAFSTDEKKIAHILDFENASHVSLNILNKNGGDLIDYWDEISYLTKYRTAIEFLDGYKRVKNSERLNMEIFEGKVNAKPVTKPGAQTGQKRYNVIGIHHKSALTTAFPPGQARLTGETKFHAVTGPNGEVYNYYKSKVQMFDEIYYSQFPNSDGFVTKDKGSTFFPDEWDTQRVLEEVALAYAQKMYEGEKLFKGKMSDGTFCAFNIEVTGKTSTGIPIEGAIESAI